MTDDRFSRLVSLACHDLRTPLAVAYGFARNLGQAGLDETAGFDERTRRFIQMIEDAAREMTGLLDELSIAARIEGNRWEPALREADTLELARAGASDAVAVGGEGGTVETEVEAVERSLAALARAAVKYGHLDRVGWKVAGRDLELTPVTAEAGPVVAGEEIRDLGSLVARRVIEELGGTVELTGETLRVRL